MGEVQHQPAGVADEPARYADQFAAQAFGMGATAGAHAERLGPG
jgi:hypothetical protein